jgi:hypothetical protein
MWRRIAVGGSAILFAALCVGCGSDGTYMASWKFFTTPDATAEGDPTQEATVACGAHGVDAIQVSAVSSGGDHHQTTALCTRGVMSDGLGTGQWQFTFRQLDARGDVIPLPEGMSDPQRSGEIKSSEPTDLGTVVFARRPACADGVDNDRDGRIDLNDPDCGDDPKRDSESADTAAAL